MKPQKILLTGGGTAGSVTPLLAVVQYVRERQWPVEFFFIGTAEGPERRLAQAANVQFHAIPSGKLRRYWSWQNLRDVPKILQGFHAARQLIRQWRPDTILTAGSFVSVPVVWAGRMAGCRIIVHQEDVRPGLANRLMAPMANIVTISFERSARSFSSKKARLTGNPVRPEILQGSRTIGQEFFGLESQTLTILVLGGGTGSDFLNRLVGATAYKLVREWQIIHVTGVERDFPELHDPRYHRVDFLTWEMPHALAAADLVLSRAGLGAITELSALGKPAVFVAMPGTHQEENAQLIADTQAGRVISQDELTANRFLALVDDLRRHPQERKHLGDNLFRLFRPDALAQLVSVVVGQPMV